MATQKKIGDRGGVEEWKALATAGDVRRLLKWAVHSLRNGTLDRADAITFSQLAAVLLKACAESDTEQRLAAIEAALAGLTNHDEPTPTTLPN